MLLLPFRSRFVLLSSRQLSNPHLQRSASLCRCQIRSDTEQKRFAAGADAAGGRRLLQLSVPTSATPGRAAGKATYSHGSTDTRVNNIDSSLCIFFPTYLFVSRACANFAIMRMPV